MLCRLKKIVVAKSLGCVGGLRGSRIPRNGCGFGFVWIVLNGLFYDFNDVDMVLLLILIYNVNKVIVMHS